MWHRGCGEGLGWVWGSALRLQVQLDPGHRKALSSLLHPTHLPRGRPTACTRPSAQARVQGGAGRARRGPGVWGRHGGLICPGVLGPRALRIPPWALPLALARAAGLLAQCHPGNPPRMALCPQKPPAGGVLGRHSPTRPIRWGYTLPPSDPRAQHLVCQAHPAKPIGGRSVGSTDQLSPSENSGLSLELPVGGSVPQAPHVPRLLLQCPQDQWHQGTSLGEPPGPTQHTAPQVQPHRVWAVPTFPPAASTKLRQRQRPRGHLEGPPFSRPPLGGGVLPGPCSMLVGAWDLSPNPPGLLRFPTDPGDPSTAVHSVDWGESPHPSGLRTPGDRFRKPPGPHPQLTQPHLTLGCHTLDKPPGWLGFPGVKVHISPQCPVLSWGLGLDPLRDPSPGWEVGASRGSGGTGMARTGEGTLLPPFFGP